MSGFPVVEATIAGLRTALEQGAVSSVELTRAYLDRIAVYDRSGIRLNSVVELNPAALEEAAAADVRRAEGRARSPLDGIPYTAKDSYMVKGQTVAAGSPAFANLVATRDAFTIERLRDAGCVFVGLTNMPPMADGGMQRGLYGRAESPYNADYLTAAFASGSSNGSGTATAASFAAFGLGEETWSSGRSPASNNGLCAYTPSRGVISTRGNWPLVPTMDVVVPHTRTMADLLEVLDVIVADDPETRGDLWRTQLWIALPAASEVRPSYYPTLGIGAPRSLVGRRFGVPAMYLGSDVEAGSGTGIGGPTGQRIEPRPSLLALWEAARADLEAAGAEVVVVDFPVVSRYEADRVDAPSIRTSGRVPPEFLDHELWALSMWAWDDFLAVNGQPGLSSLTEVEGAQIFPRPRGSLPSRSGPLGVDLAEYVVRAVNDGVIDPFEDETTALLRAGLEGLEATRKADLEDWMDGLGLDTVLFPAVADVGPHDADVSPQSADVAWRNGVWVANGNLTIRHLGIPTVTVPMGLMQDIQMPAGLTFAGHAYSDSDLLRWAAGFEQLRSRRVAPPRTPELTTASPLP